ncbi:MAG: diguanylate cyclase [bacterium]|nr:diguanylate cyclase [bacterium]
MTEGNIIQQTTQAAEPKIQTIWLPVLVGSLLFSLVVVLWWTMDGQEHSEQHERIKTEAHKLAAYIEADMRGRIPSLQRIVNRWVIRGGTPKNEFISDAQAYVSDLPGLQALEWVDKSYHVRWLIPFVGNEKAQDLDLGFEEKRRMALEKARLHRTPVMTSPIDLVQGGKGFHVYFPIFIGGEFDGFVSAVFRIREWLDYVFSIKGTPGGLNNFIVSVCVDGSCIFTQTGGTAEQSHLEAVGITEILEHRFTVQCRPTEAFIEGTNNLLSEVIAMTGLLLSILVAFIVRLFQKATTEAWRAYAAKTSLEEAIREHKKTRDELQVTYSRLALATEAGNIGVWILDIATNDVIWNDIMYQLYDVPPDVNPTYDTWRNALHPRDLPEAETLLKDAVQGKTIFATEFRILLHSGIIRHLQAAARVERDNAGNPIRMTGVTWDITERKQAEELIATKRRRLADIIEGTNVGTWEWNVQTGETVFNERWANIIGYTLKELAPVSIDTWTKFAHPDDLKESGELLKKHFENESDYYECEARMRHKDGSWAWVLDRGKVATWTEDGKPLLMSGTHQDITERKNAEEKIKHLATHDALTDLPSLKLAKDRALMAVRLARRNKTSCGIMFIDLDGFKAVNDSCGHDAGDALLKEVAKRLLACVRESDTVARIGGDEFLVTLSELQVSNKDAELIAGKLVQSISQPFSYNGEQVSIGASIGIAIFPGNGEDIDNLIKQADNAMYSIKNSGKNGYTFATPGKKKNTD